MAHTLAAAKAGYTFAAIPSITIRGANPPEVTLQATAVPVTAYTLAVNVKATGTNVAEVAVTLSRDGHVLATRDTDSAGNLTFGDLTDGTYRLSASKKG